MLDILAAAHLTYYVNSPFDNRGGIMLVAPPASLKSVTINHLVTYPNALVLSDINVRQLGDIRAAIASHQYITLAFPEFEKLYQRHDFTAQNIEGHLKAMCEEGFRHGTNEDQRMVVRPARCLVIGAMTDDLYHRKYAGWLKDGFARRFIWAHYVLEDPQAVMKAIHDWKPLNIAPDRMIFALPKASIPYELDEKTSRYVAHILRFYKQAETPFILMKKIACVLKWRFSSNGSTDYLDVLRDFSDALTMEGASVRL